MKLTSKLFSKRTESIKEQLTLFFSNLKTFALKFYTLRNMLWDNKTKHGLAFVEVAIAKPTL